MAYTLHNDGKKVILSVLVGADPVLIGLKVNHSTIISMKYQELFEIVLSTYGLAEKEHFIKSLSYHHILTVSDIVVLETICDNPVDYFASELIPKALKLYHGADIYSCYSVNYLVENNKVRFGGLGDICKGFYHARGLITPHYKLTEQELAEFPKWYESTFLKINSDNCNEKYKAMLRMYDTSYLIGICESEFIMLFTVLEMLFGKKYSDKITNQIVKGTSKLIGTSAKERRSIRNQMHMLYETRSRYVHEGNDVPHEKLFELREIVRKVLIEIFIRNYHTKDKSLKKLRDSL